jgi:hypothetical protein
MTQATLTIRHNTREKKLKTKKQKKTNTMIRADHTTSGQYHFNFHLSLTSERAGVPTIIY